MLRAHRRLEKLERVLNVHPPPAMVIRVHSVDMNGEVTGTMVLSSDPALRVPYRRTSDNGRNQSEDRPGP